MIKQCKICKKEYSLRPCRDNISKYCSKKCLGVDNAIRMKNRKTSKLTEETKRKISETLKRKGIRPPLHDNTGFKHTDESKEKMSKARFGKKASSEARKNMSLAHMGNKPTEETKEKMSEAHKGEKHWNWKGGISGENARIRRSKEYKDWRTSVYERDDYTCVFCGQRGGKLEADHIKPFADYVELRLGLSNGRTVCKKCHKEHGYNWGANQGKKRLAKNGRKGGLKVLELYGKEYFSRISRTHHSNFKN